MKNFNLGRAIAAGLVGTLVMTAIMMMAPLMGMPKMDIAAMLGSMLSSAPPAPGSSVWIIGLVMHFMIGTVVLPIGYAIVNGYLPTSSPLARGVVYGTLVYLMAQAVVMPMMGAGVFSQNLPQGTMMTMGSLLGHLIYGAVLGSIYGQQGSERTVGHLSAVRNS